MSNIFPQLAVESGIEPEEGEGLGSKWFRWALGLILVSNVLDAAFTLTWVRGLMATEANPLMAWALRLGPLCFLAMKSVLVVTGLAVLWLYRDRPVARLGIVAPALLYALITGIHLGHALGLGVR